MTKYVKLFAETQIFPQKSISKEAQMTEFKFDSVFKELMQACNLDTVVILGHLNPDGDAAGSVMSLAHYIHVNYPQYKVRQPDEHLLHGWKRHSVPLQ